MNNEISAPLPLERQCAFPLGWLLTRIEEESMSPDEAVNAFLNLFGPSQLRNQINNMSLPIQEAIRRRVELPD